MSDFDFMANAAVDALEVVPETYRGLYEENAAEGKFVLRADIKPLAEAYTGVNKRLKSLTMGRQEDNKKDATRRTVIDGLVSTLSELGWEPGDDVTKLPEVVKNKVSELMEAVKGGKDAKINVEAIRKDFEKKNLELATKKDGEIATMRKSLEKFMVGSAAATALAEAGTIEKGVELLMPMINGAARVVQDETTGEYTVRIVDGESNVRYDGKGGMMTIKDLVTELKSSYPQVFKSEQKPGTGKPPGSGKPAPGTQGTRREAELSSVGKIAAGLASLNRR